MYVLQLHLMQKKGPYTKFTLEQKAEIGKRAAEHGVAATILAYRMHAITTTRMGVAIQNPWSAKFISAKCFTRPIVIRENFVPRKFGTIRWIYMYRKLFLGMFISMSAMKREWLIYSLCSSSSSSAAV